MCLQLLSSLNAGVNLHCLKYLLNAMHLSWNQYSFEKPKLKIIKIISCDLLVTTSF